MWCSGGHQLANSSTKTRKHVSAGAATTTSRMTGAMAVAWSGMVRSFRCGPVGGFSRLGEAGEGAGPEPVEVGAEQGQASRVQAVDPPGTGRGVADEPGVTQDPQVQGDGRPRHRELGGELADRPRPLGQQVEDGPPGGVAQSVEDS